VPKQKEIQAVITRKMLDYIILKTLREQPTHGYDLILETKKTFKITTCASMIYPLLSEFEKKGYISSHWTTDEDRPRKIYQLTTKGQETLTHIEDTIYRILSTKPYSAAEE